MRPTRRAAILEIRAGTGGSEAALFAGDLFRMYERYASGDQWLEGRGAVGSSEGEAGGFKEIIATITGQAACSRKLKFESGVHRVQRVPETEASGRIHTSAATVAVLPEAEEIDIEIRPEDIRIDTMRSPPAPAASTSTRPTRPCASRICRPGLIVTSSEKSQHQNRAKAMQVLRARGSTISSASAADSERSADRKSQVGSGDRSERIRTYNFPQGRVTDHRINLTLYKLDRMMIGEKSMKSSMRWSPIIRQANWHNSANRADERARRSPRRWPRPCVSRLCRGGYRRCCDRDARVLVAGVLAIFQRPRSFSDGDAPARLTMQLQCDRERSFRTPSGARAGVPHPRPPGLSRGRDLHTLARNAGTATGHGSARRCATCAPCQADSSPADGIAATILDLGARERAQSCLTLLARPSSGARLRGLPSIFRRSALETVRENAERRHQWGRGPASSSVESDWFAAVDRAHSIIIVSNPPYIVRSDVVGHAGRRRSGCYDPRPGAGWRRRTGLMPIAAIAAGAQALIWRRREWPGAHTRSVTTSEDSAFHRLIMRENGFARISRTVQPIMPGGNDRVLVFSEARPA